MSSAINNALEAAEKAAADFAANAVNSAVPAVASEGGAVSVLPQGRRITTEDRIGGGLNVEAFIKFTQMGTITLGDDPKQFESLKLMLDLSEVEPGWGARAGSSPVIYIRTTDGVRTFDGRSWDAELARLRQIDPRCKPYDAWALPFTLLEDAGKFKAGTRIGYTTVWSSGKVFLAFYDKVKAQLGSDATVEFTLGCKGINEPGKKYGLPVIGDYLEVQHGD